MLYSKTFVDAYSHSTSLSMSKTTAIIDKETENLFSFVHSTLPAKNTL